MNNGEGRLVVISAPSGAGKSTVITRLLELRPELVLSISVTTRPRRRGEIDGESYFFVTRNQFNEMIKHGEFFEYAEYVGEYYGTPKKQILDCIKSGRDVLLEIEVQGARQIMEATTNAITIFLDTPSFGELERRLRSRGTDSEQKLAARLERARIEILSKSEYAHIVVNDDINRAAAEILSIIDT